MRDAGDARVALGGPPPRARAPRCRRSIECEVGGLTPQQALGVLHHAGPPDVDDPGEDEHAFVDRAGARRDGRRATRSTSASATRRRTGASSGWRCSIGWCCGWPCTSCWRIRDTPAARRDQRGDRAGARVQRRRGREVRQRRARRRLQRAEGRRAVVDRLGRCKRAKSFRSSSGARTSRRSRASALPRTRTGSTPRTR